MARILIVDDEVYVCTTLSRLLKRQGHSCQVAHSVAAAERTLAAAEFDMVLSDVKMPGRSGLEFVRGLATTHPHTPVVMVTGVDDTKVASVALESGAYGYIIKPYETNEILISVENTLRRARLEQQARAQEDTLRQLVEQRTKELREALAGETAAHEKLTRAHEEVIRRLSIVSEFRDEETGGHIRRMAAYCELLARHAGLDDHDVELIRLASPLHDVGKVGISDAILLKPGRYTADEFEAMKRHAEIGYRSLSESGIPILDEAATIAWTHHEKWNGEGYPRGLTGEDIPLEGRITAVADVFDALVSRRVYKEAFPIPKALGIMREGRGSHFDGALVDVFFEHLDEVLAIYAAFPDTSGDEGGRQVPIH